MMRILFVLFLMPFMAFAQDAVPAPDLADRILGWLNYIPVDGAMIGGVAIVVELVLRLFKSEKPRSIMILIAKILGAIGALLERAGEFLDKIVPQKLK